MTFGTEGSVKVSGLEDGQTYYYIHWIDAKLPGGEEAGEEIKGRLERGLRRVWE